MVEDGLAHGLHCCPGPTDVPDGEISGSHGQSYSLRCDLLQRVGHRGKHHRVPCDRIGGCGIDGEPGGPLGGQGQGEKDVPSAVLMVVDADSRKPGGLASSDEIRRLQHR